MAALSRCCPEVIKRLSNNTSARFALCPVPDNPNAFFCATTHPADPCQGRPFNRT